LENFSIRDLRPRTGELVREAEAGHLSIVAKHGRPLFVASPRRGHSRRFGSAALFRTGSQHRQGRQAARLPSEDFITHLGAMGVLAVDYPADELDEELAADRPGI
jgi:prevent-host-death family protein